MHLRPVVIASLAALCASTASVAADPVPDWPVKPGLEIVVSLDGVSAGSLSDVALGVFDAKGSLTGTCLSASKTELVKSGESHWLANGGETHWRCTLDGEMDAESALMLTSKTVERVWLVSAVSGDDAVILDVDGSKVGSLTLHDIKGFDIDGEQPTWFDIDGEQPTWFDLDGEEPTWYGAGWIKGSRATIASQDHGGTEPDW